MKRHLRSSLVNDPSPEHDLMGAADPLLALALSEFDMGTWRIDIDTGKVLWSQRVYEIHGLEPAQGAVDITQAIRYYHPQDAKTVAWLVSKALEDKKGFNFVLRLQLPDEKLRLVQSIASVTFDSEGQVDGIVGLFRDVTQDYTQKDISQARGKLVQTIIRNSPVPIVVMDRELNYLEVSPAWAKHHGLGAPASLVGLNHFHVLPDLPEKWRSTYQQVLDGEVIHRKSVLSKDGSEIHGTGAVLVPWVTANGDIGGIIIMHVVSEGADASDVTLEQLANLMIQQPTRSQKK